MAQGGEHIELKFRIYDGTDIAHSTYAPSTTVATLKQRLVAEWPQGHPLMNSLNCFTNHIHGLPLASNAFVCEMFIHSMHMHVRVWVHHMFTDKSVVPKSVSDIKLIHAGKVLENGKTLAESRVHFGDLPGGVSTMHVVVQPPVPKKKTDKNQEKNHKQNSCSCAIL